jgi:hypothetical protein
VTFGPWVYGSSKCRLMISIPCRRCPIVCHLFWFLFGNPRSGRPWLSHPKHPAASRHVASDSAACRQKPTDEKKACLSSWTCTVPRPVRWFPRAVPRAIEKCGRDPDDGLAPPNSKVGHGPLVSTCFSKQAAAWNTETCSRWE